ncbi:MAG: sugar isomerase domain-containing protein [Breznakia sp.]
MIDTVFERGLVLVKTIQTTQRETIDTAAKMIAAAFVDGHHFFVSGSGHSHTVAEEFYGRAGCLAFPIPILTNELTLNEHPTKSSAIERLEGYAKILLNLYHVRSGDVVLVASNSGRNAYPVELALEAKAIGARVIAITSKKHSSNTASRHKSGKKLMDVADVVIDNCGEVGDSCLALDGVDATMLPTSSIANAFIAQAIEVMCAKYIVDSGVKPPVFVSLNVDGNTSVNEAYFKEYTRLY